MEDMNINSVKAKVLTAPCLISKNTTEKQLL